MGKLFEGVCASSVTPFDGRGGLRLDRLKPHIDWLIADGVHAISPLGSSGEFPALEVEDRKRVLEAALEAVGGRVPVVAGTHHYTTRHTVELSRHAEAAGADALLIVPPYYMAPTPAQVMDHFRRVAEAVSIPIVLYHNIPLTAVDLRTGHLLQLFEEGAIAGVKMSNAEPDRIAELLQATDRALVVYAGIDSVAFEGLCHGAHGWISGIPSMVPGGGAAALRGDRPQRPAGGPRPLEAAGPADAAPVQRLPLAGRGGELVQRDEGRAQPDRPPRGRPRAADPAAPRALPDDPGGGTRRPGLRRHATGLSREPGDRIPSSVGPTPAGPARGPPGPHRRVRRSAARPAPPRPYQAAESNRAFRAS